MSQKKILIIDDEFPIRYMVEHQLRRHDFDVHSAKDGPSGLKVAHEYAPDLIVLDIMMPGMDGFEVCQAIRSSPETAATPIIFLTASMSRESKLRAYKAGGNDFLEKPFKANELLAHVRSILKTDGRSNTGDNDMERGRIISLFSPKGGVGTTTLAIQLSEALAIRDDRPVVLIDLDLPFGGIGPTLNLYNNNNRHIVGLLRCRPEAVSLSLIKRFAQPHRPKLFVIPAPDNLTQMGQLPRSTSLKSVLETLVTSDCLVVLDLGSSLSHLTVEALRQSDIIYAITSGQPVSNKLYNQFASHACELGLDTKRILPVINELHGPARKMELSRIPVARIPHDSERSRTKMWLREQGMEKLVSVTL